MADQEKSDDTYTRYNDIAVRFIRQFVSESPRTDLVDMAYEDLSMSAIQWFLDSHERWSPDYVRQLAAALTQWGGDLRSAELVSHQTIEKLLDRLENDRPKAKPKKSGSKKTGDEKSARHVSRRRRAIAKSIKPANLRRLIAYFRNSDDHFNVWIAGYLQLASRIGWRPGEIFEVWLDGNYLCALGEKHTNERGLCGICEIGLHQYPPSLIGKLDLWISEMEHWLTEYEGRWKLEDVINKRIQTGCVKLGIPPICVYTLRHFAIACMKKSGLTREEIAVIVNHASTRTATEHYGKARTGRKRPQKMFRIDPWRLSLVRSKARNYNYKKTANAELGVRD